MKKPVAASRNSSTLPFVLETEIRVRVTPRGGRDSVIGIRADDGAILLRVAALPIHGAANRACIGLLANVLGLRKAQVVLLGGETSRDKRFRISGMSAEERDRRLALLPPRGDMSP